MERNKQVETAEEVRRASLKAQQDAASYITIEERDKAERTKLYHTLKARSALDIYYQLYPDERPKGEPAKAERSRDDGRER